MNVYRVFAKSAALTAGLTVLGMGLAGCQTTAKALGMTKVVPDEFRVVTKAGGDKADPLVRYVVDDEFGDLAHKEPSFADKVLFWKKDKAAAAASKSAKDSGAETAAPIDPQIEANRLKSLIGDKKVIIQREQTSGVKLPGL